MKYISLNRVSIGFIALVTLTVPAVAATETVLYSFPDSGTGIPNGKLYLGGGSLYGTGIGDHRTGNGQVFRLTNKGGSWEASMLVAFDGTNGALPFAGLVRGSSGVLYGTTWYGGGYDGGSVFALYKSGGKWVEQTIWAFGGTGDGTRPECDLVIDKFGNLYGTTNEGGAYNLGTAFELSDANGVWTETLLYSFKGNGDGWYPYAGLLMAGPDRFYGTTSYGGNAGGDGTVFERSSPAACGKRNCSSPSTAPMATNPWER